jgi:hypothetical protein
VASGDVDIAPSYVWVTTKERVSVDDEVRAAADGIESGNGMGDPGKLDADRRGVGRQPAQRRGVRGPPRGLLLNPNTTLIGRRTRLGHHGACTRT